MAIAGGGFIAQSKRLPGVEVVEISQADRDAKTEAVAARFLAAGDGNSGNDKAAWRMRLSAAHPARNLCCCCFGSWLMLVARFFPRCCCCCCGCICSVVFILVCLFANQVRNQMVTNPDQGTNTGGQKIGFGPNSLLTRKMLMGSWPNGILATQIQAWRATCSMSLVHMLELDRHCVCVCTNIANSSQFIIIHHNAEHHPICCHMGSI